MKKSPPKILTENLSENVSAILFHLGRANPSKSQLKIFLKILTKERQLHEKHYLCTLWKQKP